VMHGAYYSGTEERGQLDWLRVLSTGLYTGPPLEYWYGRPFS
jgi:hypothetical protein